MIKKLVSASISLSVLLSAAVVLARTSPSPAIPPSKTPKAGQNQNEAEKRARQAAIRACQETLSTAKETFREEYKNASGDFLAEMRKIKTDWKESDKSDAAKKIYKDAKKAAQVAYRAAKEAARTARKTTIAAFNQCVRKNPTPSPTPSPTPVQ